MSFGVMEALLSFFRRQVGLRTDTASATGSLHAKLTEAKSVIIGDVFPWHKKTHTLTSGLVAQIPENANVTIISITGNRVVLGGKIISSSNQSYMQLQFYVDGSMVFGGATSLFASFLGCECYPAYSTAAVFQADDAVNKQWVIDIPSGLHFNTSLEIVVSHSSLGGNNTDFGAFIWHVPA